MIKPGHSDWAFYLEIGGEWLQDRVVASVNSHTKDDPVRLHFVDWAVKLLVNMYRQNLIFNTILPSKIIVLDKSSGLIYPVI
jgi:hypothetical protein